MAAQPVSSRIQEEMFMLSTEATGDVDRDRGGRRGGGGGGNSGRSHGGRGRYISAATRGGVPRSRTHPASSGTAASLSFDILALPDEIIYHIVSFLDGKSLSALARTSHFFHELALTDDMWKGVWHQTWRLPFEDSVIVSVPAAYQRGVISDSVPHSVRDFVQARWYIERFVQAGGNVDVWRSKLGLNARHVRTGAQLRELFIRWVKPCLRILFLDLGKFNAGRNYNSLRAQFMSPGIQHSSALPSILTCNYRGILALVLAEQIRAAFVLSVTREQQLGALELLVVLLRELILNGHLMLFGLPRCVESGYVRERLRFEYVSQLCSLFTGAMEPLLEGLPGSTDVELRIQMSAFLFQAYGAVALSARLQPEILGLMRTRASAQYEFLHSQGPSAHWAITEFHSFRLNVASQLVALDRLDEAEPDLTDLMRLLREDGDAIREVVGSALYEIVLETMCHVERLLAMIAERRQVSLGASHEAVGEVVMPYFNRQLTLIERIATEIELTPEQDSIAADVLARKSEYLSTADAAAVLKLAVLRYGKVANYEHPPGLVTSCNFAMTYVALSVAGAPSAQRHRSYIGQAVRLLQHGVSEGYPWSLFCLARTHAVLGMQKETRSLLQQLVQMGYNVFHDPLPRHYSDFRLFLDTPWFSALVEASRMLSQAPTTADPIPLLAPGAMVSRFRVLPTTE